jgi:AcrR family transcriptional regulator
MVQNGPMPMTARERARLEITAEIKAVARRHLAETGATSLSLRAVARDVGMVSSAVYRYFASRDDLLTALIVDAYRAVGECARDAETAVRRSDLMGRWLSVTTATRTWAIANPHEYALIFGTPVPGYAAPEDTIDPAAMIPLLLLTILVDAVAAGASTTWAARPLPRAVRADVHRIKVEVTPTLPEPIINQGMLAWTALIGSISFELFGHFRNVVVDHDAYFENQMRNLGVDLGLAGR